MISAFAIIMLIIKMISAQDYDLDVEITSGSQSVGLFYPGMLHLFILALLNLILIVCNLGTFVDVDGLEKPSESLLRVGVMSISL